MFSISIIIYALVLETEVDTDMDVVAVNEIVKQAESHWEHIEQGDYSRIKLQFTVLDPNGKLLYRTLDGPSTDLNDAIKKEVQL